MSFTLLIWEEAPERTRMFLIPNVVADSYRKFLIDAHNKFINLDASNDGLKFLNMALCKTEDRGYAEEGFEEYNGLFVDYEQSTTKPISNQIIHYVYLSGFML